MPAKPKKKSARERILEAAEQVVSDVGAGNMTLDAVAAAAGVSKGGLLYHFASKEALLKGMVDRHMDDHQARLAATHARLGNTPATYLRAFLETEMELAREETHSAAVSRSFLAAAANFPSLLERPRREFAAHFARLREAGGNFPLAALVSLAYDGLYFGDIFEISALTAEERAQLAETMLVLADRTQSGAAP
jgi:AcrR family transcriptional regulator